MNAAHRPKVIIAGIVLGLGALGGISGAALGGLATAAGVEHGGGHAFHERHGDDPSDAAARDDDGVPPVPAAPAAPGAPAPAAPTR